MGTTATIIALDLGKFKTVACVMDAATRGPQDWEIGYEDLGNVYARARIQELQRLRLDVDGPLLLAV